MALFPTTRQSAVLALRDGNSAERARALDVLAEVYWKPVYKHLRRKWTPSPDDAADLTQGFFAKALEKDFFGAYNPAKASFRTYLRLCLDHFAANEAKAAGRQKRGGGVTTVSFDYVSAEGELREHPAAAAATLDDLFHQEWTRQVLARTVEALRLLAAERGKPQAFALFERYDIDPPDVVSYASLAAEFSLPVTTVTNQLFWARREFRRLVRETLSQMTASDREFRDEVRALLGEDA